LSIPEATGEIRAAMKEVMADLSSAEAIIVDVRFNQGGYDTIGYEIASFFNDEARVVSQKRARDGDRLTPLQDISIGGQEEAFLGPVYLLTSRNTVSAAETFSLAMRELPNVTLVGTRTYGSLSDSLGRLLPNGWLVSLSNEIYQSPDGEIFESEGVPPDELIEYDETETVRSNLDRVLSKAVELAGR
jgi:carboxyl-terminal processing protease